MSIFKYCNFKVQLTNHWLNLAQSYFSHFDPRRMDSPTSQKKANPNMKRRTRLSNILPTTSGKDLNPWTHSEGKFINYNIPLPRIYMYICAFYESKVIIFRNLMAD